VQMQFLLGFDTYPPYSGPSLLELLDNLPLVDRKINGAVMMPISEKYKDLGTVVVGKLESGRMKKGDSLLLMPNKVSNHCPSVLLRALPRADAFSLR
jgi:translation elongation factor EF-1alpha